MLKVELDVAEARGGHDDGTTAMRVADMHVRDVDTEEGRLQAPVSPELVHPPEDVVLEAVVARDADASQGGHAL